MINFKQFLKEAEYDSWDHERSNDEIDNLNEKLKEHHKYLPSQREPLERYTKDSTNINSHLWEAHENKEMPDDDYEHYASKISYGIHENKAPHDFHVYSGTLDDPRKRMNSKGIVHHPAFLSTSLSHQVAKSFASPLNHKNFTVTNPDYDPDKYKYPHSNSYPTKTITHYEQHILKIRVPKDHPGAYVEHISDKPGEYEHILPRGLNLKHTGTDIIHEKKANYRITTHIHHFDIA